MFGFGKKKRQKFSLLDKWVMMWDEHNPLTARDLCNGGVCVMGRSGSAKTTGAGKALGRGVLHLRHEGGLPATGGLILAAKPEDEAMWRRWFRQAGRPDDLIVFGPGESARWNFLDYVLTSGGTTRECTRCLTTIGETLRASDNKGAENADFWEKEQTRMLYNAIEVVKLATGRIDPWDLQRFINGAAMAPEQLKDDAWRRGFHCQTLARAATAPKSGHEAHDFDLAVEYWLGEIPAMADKTRSSIMTGVNGILHTFNTGLIRELASTTTNVTPRLMFEGKFVLVNAPPAEYGDTGLFLNAGAKFLTQRAVLRRHAEEGDCVNVIWADEFPNFFNSFDSHYVRECRSHLGAMCVLAQGRDSFYSVLGGMRGKHQTDQFLAQMHHKVFHALGSAEDGQYASSLIGQGVKYRTSYSVPPVESLWEEMMGRTRVSFSGGPHVEPIIQPNEFQNGLRTGGPENGLTADAIVVRSGMPFSTGQNFLRVSFSQRD